MSNRGRKKLPTLRESYSPEQLDIFQRDVRNVLRGVWEELEELEAHLDECCDEEEAPPSGGAVDEVTAGSAAVSVSPTTGSVVVDVVEANFSGIPQAGVSGLVADLASKVADTRTISTTAPLAGGGDLSANRTLTISNFSSGAAGAVPASGGSTSDFLRADGWNALPGRESLTDSIGTDGTLVFDGSATVAGLVPAANVYTMTQDILAINVTVDSGVTIRTASYRIFCLGTLTNNGTIQNNGSPGTGVGASPIAGGVGAPSGFFAGGGAGGSSTSNVAGSGGTSVTNGMRGVLTATSTNLAGAATLPGSNGNVRSRGAGGGGAHVSNAGGSAGQIALTTAVSGSASLSSLSLGCPATAPATRWQIASGGGGGGSLAGILGGSGGGGAGIVYCQADILDGSGVYNALGGNGGTGNGNALNSAGGGGGGGGGLIVLVGRRVGSYTTAVTGGTGGLKGTPSGAGGNGGNGADGLVIELD